MAISIAKILYDAAECTSRLLYDWTGAPPSIRESAERGAQAVALHVLAVAAPTSPILTAMRQGASFERAQTLALSDEPCRGGCTVACEATEAHAQRRLDAGRAFLAEFRREERERSEAAAKRIDEPSPAEFAEAIGEIFAGVTGEKPMPECPNAGPAKVVGVPLGHTIEVLRADHAETLNALAASERPMPAPAVATCKNCGATGQTLPSGVWAHRVDGSPWCNGGFKMIFVPREEAPPKAVLSGEAEQAFIDHAQEEGLQYAAENYPVTDPALKRLIDAYNAAGKALSRACGLGPEASSR